MHFKCSSYCVVINELPFSSLLCCCSFFRECCENDSKLKEWVDCGLKPKIYFRIFCLGLGRGSLALALGLWP